jgi:hypothetical protein
VMPCWVVVEAVRGPGPSGERSAADRRARSVALGCHPAQPRVWALGIVVNALRARRAHEAATGMGFLEQFARRRPLNDSMKAFCPGLPGAL